MSHNKHVTQEMVLRQSTRVLPGHPRETLQCDEHNRVRHIEIQCTNLYLNPSQLHLPAEIAQTDIGHPGIIYVKRDQYATTGFMYAQPGLSRLDTITGSKL